MNLHGAARARLRAEKQAQAKAARPVGKKQAKRRRRGFRAFGLVLDCAGVFGAVTFAFVFNLAMHPDAIAQEPSAMALLSVFTASPLDGEAPAALDPAPAMAAPLVEPDPAEVRLLAATAWAEARSEGEPGMRAVAHVIVNRVGARFGDDLEDVIRSPKQFSAWNLGDPNRPLAQNPERYARGGINRATWEDAQKVAREVLSGQSVDPTDGALFYHTAAIRPWWSRYGHGRQQIGAHVFYSDVPDRRSRG